MERIVEFKGYDKQTKDWLELTDNNEWYNKRCLLFRSFFSNHVLLLQYTGLKDMNNKKIFQEDILANTINNRIVVVKYGPYKDVLGDEWYGFYLKGKEFNYKLPYDTSRIIVIGNTIDSKKIARGWFNE